MGNNGKCNIRKRLFWESPYKGCALIPAVNTYVSKESGTLIGRLAEHVLTENNQAAYHKFTVIRSDNNGRDWTVVEEFKGVDSKPDGLHLTFGPSFFMDTEANILLRFFLKRHSKDENYWGVDASNEQFYQISRDEGNTWGEKKPLFCRDKIVISNTGIKLNNGEMLFPFCKALPLEERGKGKWGNFQAGVVTGRGKKDSGEMEWNMGGQIRILWKKSRSGLGEPALAQLRDGQILSIMRASQNLETGAPPLKYYSLSEDNGLHWSEPEPLSFDTGEVLYSPQAISGLIRSSKNGKLYWIGNILPSPEMCNEYGHRPRHPLQIAELDEERIGIRKESMSIIDDQKEGDVEREYSNFSVYEDHETENFVLMLCEQCAAWLPDKAPCKEEWTANGYRYDITCPDKME